MYLEIDNLEISELEKLQDMFGDRIRRIFNIYTEVCRIEADCTVDMLKDSGELTAENIDLDELAVEISYNCEDSVFSVLCEESERTVREHYNI